MLTTTPYAEALRRFESQQVITVATGATCAYLGDERNLREFLVADETARTLRRAGHTVFFLLIDDSLDPLNFRQLRVAVNKDELLLERFKHWCGKPISHLTDPWGCHESYAAHFEEELLGRLHSLDCHPNLITTSHLYDRGVYKPYVQLVLKRHDEIMQFLAENFQGYEPEKLFWPLCPHCGYIHETDIENIGQDTIQIYCRCCEQPATLSFDEVKGKLNWKLDCAVRWALFRIDAEPFSKSYMEPLTGTFAVAQALCKHFFDGPDVLPLNYGLVKMDKKLGGKLLESLPVKVMRPLMVDRPGSDVTFTRDLMVTAASRYEVMAGMTYLDFIKQHLPMWLLTPDVLSPMQRDLVAHGIAFQKHFLNADARLHLPSRATIECEKTEVLAELRGLLVESIGIRENGAANNEQFHALLHPAIDALQQKKATLRRLRAVVGQQQGLPASRILFMLPLDYLQMLEYMLTLYLQSVGFQEQAPALRSVPAVA